MTPPSFAHSRDLLARLRYQNLIATGRVSYLRDDRDVRGDVRSAEPEGLAGAGACSTAKINDPAQENCHILHVVVYAL